MGVQGLWHILQSTGVDIDLSSLEGKVLAIDLSIWLNQALKSGIDSPHIHLEILFKRICKLLYYKIKPIFVFDGPCPSLKRETILYRRKQRQLKLEKSNQIKSNIVRLLMDKAVTQKRKHINTKTCEKEDLFKLPENEYFDILLKNSFERDYGFSDMAVDYMSCFPSSSDVDIESESFKSMPFEVQHEVIRTIAKEKRYGYDTNEDSFANKSIKDFSTLQIQKILNRNVLQQKVEDLRVCMNNQNNKDIMGSLKLQKSFNQISSKKISNNEGYLLMIDPSENDIVDSITNVKKEYLFQKKFESEKRNLSSKNSEANELGCLNNVSSEIKSVENKSNLNEQSSIIQTANKTDIVSDTNLLMKDNELSTAQNILPIVLDNSPSTGREKPSDFIQSHEDTSTLHPSDIICEENFKSNNEISKDNEISHKIAINFSDDSKRILHIPGNDFDPLFEDAIEVATQLTTKESELHNKNIFPIEFRDVDEADNLDSNAGESEDDFIEVPEIPSEKDDFTKSTEFYYSEMEAMNNDSWHQDIDDTISDLYNEEHKYESQAINISERYYQEAKELLKLFGLPYIESPGEAEAQCAYLEKSKLIDGTITEDSDIWLFGGSMVYKHVFSQGWAVRAYSKDQIFKILGLSQDHMICIALLSGSDYTPGIYGVGPVNAMEILADFSDHNIEQSYFEVLHTFKNWHEIWSKNSLEYSGNPDKKRYLRFYIPSNFPDSRVVDAYNNPLVDESKDQFIWSKPAIDKLLEFAQYKIGWERLKVLELLEMINNEGKSSSKCNQRTLLDFWDTKVNFPLGPDISSKRLKIAAKQRNLIVKNVKKS